MHPCATFFASLLKTRTEQVRGQECLLYSDGNGFGPGIYGRRWIEQTGLGNKLSWTYRNDRRKCLATANGE
jgi:hypothetical protein